MSNPKITAYVTKYALSSGILKVEAMHCVSDSESMISYRGKGAYADGYAHGNEWHLTPEAAVTHAEEMRKKKIASLKKQIEKLEKLEFKVHD